MNFFVIFKYGLFAVAGVIILYIFLNAKTPLSGFAGIIHTLMISAIIYWSVNLYLVASEPTVTYAKEALSARIIKITELDNDWIHFVDMNTNETLKVSRDKAIVLSDEPNIVYEYKQVVYEGHELFHLSKYTKPGKVVFE